MKNQNFQQVHETEHSETFQAGNVKVETLQKFRKNGMIRHFHFDSTEQKK